MSKRILSFDEFLTENDMKSAKLFNVASIGYIPALILEGGAAGHMMHPFDDNSLTFGDLHFSFLFIKPYILIFQLNFNCKIKYFLSAFKCHQHFSL